MQQFVIEGGHELNGIVVPSGNKNAALPMLAACLLTEETVTLHNVPLIRDVGTMVELLRQIGIDVQDDGQGTLVLQARHVQPTQFDPVLFQHIRGSILLAGPMLARFGFVNLPRPGGDKIGRRRVDTHMLALQDLGAEITLSKTFRLQAKKLQGADILLTQASVTGTENAVMAAALVPGTTILRNAACEPHVQELCQLINRMGGQIEGIGSNTLTIHGVERLGGAEFDIGSDFMEIGSFIGLGAVTGGEILIKKAVPEHMRMVRLVYERLGVRIEVQGDDILVPRGQSLTVVPDMDGSIPEIADMPWPAFPPDLMSVALVVATQSAGTVLFHEKMFESRLYFVDKLIGMGARIILCDPHRAVVQGPSWLNGDELVSPDIRAGMALLVAALCARGQSIIRNIIQIDRGYEQIDAKLRALGAHIERVEVDGP
ncbi:MAG: UDP-N-acetylglucosamine 1-carboxyvinyltransferase [Anaerolineae bacterium]|jgi:UDP-N-acetylglucosamine 1-carboxyvinyltransferase